MQRYISPNGNLIVAILESTPCSVGIEGISADGTEVEYDGNGSTMFWDDQKAVKRNGSLVFLDEEGGQWSFDQLSVAPESDEETED